MAQALQSPMESKILQANPSMTFRNGSYLYAVAKTKDGGSFTVTDGKRSISAPIRWAVGYGTGEVGQTFVLEYGGLFYESRVSYFAQAGRLDITVGHPREEPEILEEALGNWLGDAALMSCLQCHATAATTADRLQVDRMIPGVACEGCHGPGADHIEAVRSGTAKDSRKDSRIFNPGHLAPGRIADFCGACHRTPAQQEVMRVQGPENVRFQGYRLEGSRCYNPDDSRITCTACHNPHQPAELKPSVYDAKCVACHNGEANTSGARTAPSNATPAGLTEAKVTDANFARHCPVGKRECVTCHMPEVPVPGAHTRFTDHRIRVVRPNEAYPN
jgi:hypothetical protein